MLNWRQSTKKQRSSCIPRWYCKRRFRVLRSIHRTRIISISNDSSKSHGYHFQIAWLRRTSSGCSICLYLGKMEDAHKLLRIPKSECPDIWIRPPRHKWPKSWSSMEDPVVPLERNLYSHLLAGLLMERLFEKILLQHGWVKGFQLGMLIRTPSKRVILICVRGWHQIAGKKQNINPMRKVLDKEVDVGEPTSFLGLVYMGCTQRQCQISKDIVHNHRTMFESRISAGRTEKLPYSENFRVSSWSYDMEGHAKKCVERYCELANKTTQQL